MIIIDQELIVWMYDHLLPAKLWLLNSSTNIIPSVWVMDDVASVQDRTFGQQFTVWFFPPYVWLQYPHFITCHDTAPIPQCTWNIKRIFQKRNHVLQLRAENEAFGHINEYSMMVIRKGNAYCTLTTPSVTCLTWLTKILFVNLVNDLVCAFPLKRKCKSAREFIGWYTAVLRY